MPQLIVGQLVKSTAGRDKGRYMLVMQVIDKEYVYLVDGDLRKVENPKKKKIKHLKPLNVKAKELALKLQKKRKVTNKEVSKALKELVDGNNTSV